MVLHVTDLKNIKDEEVEQKFNDFLSKEGIYPSNIISIIKTGECEYRLPHLNGWYRDYKIFWWRIPGQ